MRKLTCLFTMLIVVLFSQAQQKQLSGTVSNKTTGNPLRGVTVQTENKTVTTDVNGKFSIEIVAGETITFTHVGMKKVTITAGKTNAAVNVEMEEGTSD